MSADASHRVLGCVRRAVTDYGMIRAGETVTVGLSGGKDSLTLLAALAALRRFLPTPFSLRAVTVDTGAPGGGDFAPLSAFCASLGVPHLVIPTDIYAVVFEARREKNPCALCAKLRRGALCGEARAAGSEVLALGHHMGDAVDTFLLNLFFEGRIGCFSPVTDLGGLRLVRPLLYLEEKEIVYYAHAAALPVTKSTCPMDGASERANLRRTLDGLDAAHRGVRRRIFGAVCRGGIDGFREEKPPGGGDLTDPSRHDTI